MRFFWNKSLDWMAWKDCACVQFTSGIIHTQHLAPCNVSWAQSCCYPKLFTFTIFYSIDSNPDWRAVLPQGSAWVVDVTFIIKKRGVNSISRIVFYYTWWGKPVNCLLAYANWSIMAQLDYGWWRLSASSCEYFSHAHPCQDYNW